MLRLLNGYSITTSKLFIFFIFYYQKIEVKTSKSGTRYFILTENSLRCGEQGIQLTYTGNGADFSFMNVMDVYSLFGNAVSNAVEAVQKVENPEKRVIDILSERKGDLINITVTNFFCGQLVLDNGLPVTTKAEEKGFHGYGMKSMQLIAQKYGGNLHCSSNGDLFMLHIYLLQQ